MTFSFRLWRRLFGAIALIALVSAPALANDDVTFPTTKKDGSPDRRRGAGSRSDDSCLVGETPEELLRVPFALVPESNKVVTSSAHPEFFWYMPPTTRGNVIFSLNEAGGEQKMIYRTEFMASGSEGLARLSLPTGMGGLELEANKPYQWSVILDCSPEEAEGLRLGFTSQIQRISPSTELASQLKVSSGLQQAELYAENGFWEDSLAALADLQCGPERDTGLMAQQELFMSQGLEYFNQVPPMDNCDCSCH